MFNRVCFALITALGVGSPVSLFAVQITQWNFNGDSATTVPGGTASPTPSSGTGVASLVGTTASFASGIASGGSSDPVTTSPPNYAWNTTTYPAQGTGDKTRGAQFLVSTVGFNSIMFSYDLRHSNTSSRYEQVQYTLDGSTWTDAVQFDGPMGDTWFNGRMVDLSGVAGASNNALFGLRVVATFGPSGAYEPSNATSTYGPAGTWRFDMVTISGNSISNVTGDFNNDLLFNCLDVDALVAEIALGTNSAAFDMNGDTFVNTTDLSLWLVVGGQNNPAQTGGNPFLAGDANLSGEVDGEDFGVWNANKDSAIPAWCSGDFTANGLIDNADFSVWFGNRFQSSSLAVVPEPECAGLVALGLALLRVGLRRTVG
jgi:hypothetical protein